MKTNSQPSDSEIKTRLKTCLLNFIENACDGKATSEADIKVVPEAAKILFDLINP